MVTKRGRRKPVRADRWGQCGREQRGWGLLVSERREKGEEGARWAALRAERGNWAAESAGPKKKKQARENRGKFGWGFLLFLFSFSQSLFPKDFEDN